MSLENGLSWGMTTLADPVMGTGWRNAQQELAVHRHEDVSRGNGLHAGLVGPVVTSDAWLGFVAQNACKSSF